MIREDLLKENGFTLVELLVALLILAIGIIALAGLQVAAIKGNVLASRLTAATTLAEERMEELISIGFNDLTNTGGWTQPEKISGVTGGGSFARQHRIAEPAAGALKLVEVRVIYTDSLGQSRQISLSSYVAR